eukprot:351309-Chlamydomonas_euryale.AAC.3
MGQQHCASWTCPVSLRMFEVGQGSEQTAGQCVVENSFCQLSVQTVSAARPRTQPAYTCGRPTCKPMPLALPGNMGWSSCLATPVMFVYVQEGTHYMIVPMPYGFIEMMSFRWR